MIDFPYSFVVIRKGLSACVKTTWEKSVQKYLLRFIEEDSSIDCDPKE